MYVRRRMHACMGVYVYVCVCNVKSADMISERISRGHLSMHLCVHLCVRVYFFVFRFHFIRHTFESCTFQRKDVFHLFYSVRFYCRT